MPTDNRRATTNDVFSPERNTIGLLLFGLLLMIGGSALFLLATMIEGPVFHMDCVGSIESGALCTKKPLWEQPIRTIVDVVGIPVGFVIFAIGYALKEIVSSG